MRYLLILALVTGAAFASDADVSPWMGTPGAGESALTQLDYFDIEALGASNRCVGVGFDGTNFWVTDAQSAGGPLWIHIITGDLAHTLVTTVDQNGTSGWGLRDLCWDGTYMYGSQSTTVQYYDGSYARAGSFTSPASNPNRAMAWDGTYFYTGSFSADIYQVTWDGVSGSTASFTTWSSAISNNGTYGAAWDATNNCLWVSTASNDGLLFQLDATGTLITTYDQSPENVLAGGCTMGNYAGTDGDQLWVLAQATPDGVYCWEVVVPLERDTWGSIKTIF